MVDVKVGKFDIVSRMTKNNKTIYVSRDIPALWFGTYRVPIWEGNSDVIEQIIEEKNFTNIEDVENLILEKNYITLDDVDTVVGPQGAQGAQGETGAQGAEGKRGQDGRTYYTWIKYADDAQGNGLSDSPILDGGIFKEFIGFAYNKLTPEESTDPLDYVWTKFKGTDGENGVGVKGDDGITYYTWIKYADHYPTQDSDMYDTPNGNTEYIGISVNNLSEVEGTDYRLYSWTKFKGDKGAQGLAGKDGETVITYTWIKYADDVDGRGMTNEPYENGVRKMYIGFAYNKNTPVESNNPDDYDWVQFAGTDGKDGVGYTGEDGKTYYMWIKYSDVHPSINPNIYDEPHEGTEFIGIAANKEQPEESNDWTLYSWSKFKGDQGVQGETGAQGAQGVAYYTWIKYADDINGNGMSDSPFDAEGNRKLYIGFGYNKLTDIESDDPADYQWIQFAGTDGTDGQAYVVNGKTFYMWIKYADVYPTKDSDIYDEPHEGTEWIGIAANQEEEHESTNWTLYTWSKFKGDKGVQGDVGAQGADGITKYTWIKYADDAQGTGMCDTPYDTEGNRKNYIGFAYDRTSPEESDDWRDYKWTLFVGADGPQGIPGGVGKDGETYYTWIKYADEYPTAQTVIYDEPRETTEWIGIATNKKDINESWDYLEYDWSHFKGAQGVAGIDGITQYTWIKYADDADGSGIANEPYVNGVRKLYIGFAYGKTTPIESNDPNDYTWSLFVGADGPQGIPGEIGPDGKTYYTWIKYSTNYPSKNSDIYDVPTEETEWIGIATNQEEQNESNDWTLYSWSKFKGDEGVPGAKGDKGDKGDKGADGKTLYTWIKYADDNQGTGFSDSPIENGVFKTYIGFAYGKESALESNDWHDYTWSLFKGTDGEKGIPGEVGEDGKTYYTWIKYSDKYPTSNSDLYDTPTVNTEYIGISVNNETEDESWDWTAYVWSKFKGDQGVPGKNAQSLYTWIMYADDAVGNGMSNAPVDEETGEMKKYIGFAWNKETDEESMNPSDYTWSLFAATNGSDGIGYSGQDGKTYYMWLKYADQKPSSDKPEIYDEPTENTEYIGIAVNQLVAQESTDWRKYTWSKFKGDKGVKGDAGISYYTWIKYADDAEGNGMTDEPFVNGVRKLYIGLGYNKLTPEESWDPTEYTWTRFAGTDGEDGLSVKGEDGITYYTWIKYATVYPETAADMYDEPTEETEWMGISVNNVSKYESWDPTDYTWTDIKGPQGAIGRTGDKGDKGDTTFTWIRYADDDQGTGFSNEPFVNGVRKMYIGMAYNQTTPIESEDWHDYTWVQWLGTDGKDGIGVPGADGKTYYTWIKYSDEYPNSNEDIYDTPTERTKYMGISVNNESQVESNDWRMYSWELIKGADGVPGKDGSDGVTTYTWIKYADNRHGDGISDSPLNEDGSFKEYIGFAYNKLTPEESNNPGDYQWSLFKGTNGTNGVDGEKGENGETYYTWIKYATVYPTTDEHIYDEPTELTQWIGIAVNKLTIEESNNYKDYTWSKFQGAQGVAGERGEKGERGEAGKTYYTWIKYADDAEGLNMTDSPLNENGTFKAYIGFAFNKETPVESNNAVDYTWSKFTGEDGINGKDGIGIDGEDGKTYYMWIKYADNFPTRNSDIYDEPKETTEWIGISYNNIEQHESDDWTVYDWSHFKGDQGVAGTDGVDGITYYTWIRYANDDHGTGMTDVPYNNDGTFKKYIGFAYNMLTPVESTNPGDYIWSLFAGTDGTDGIPGEKGADGTTYYTWIKYADVFPTSNDIAIYDSPKASTEWIGIAVNQLVMAESSDYTKYVWSKFKGDQGVAGPKGDKGVDGTSFSIQGAVKNWVANSSDYLIGISELWAVDSPFGLFWKENGEDHLVVPSKGDAYIINRPNDEKDGHLLTTDGQIWIDCGPIKGERGEQGEKGERGNDGVATYTWIKYADDREGNGMSNSPMKEDGTFKMYIGFAYNMVSRQESNNPQDYEWTLFAGANGKDGIDGVKGADGKTYYTWIKYADVIPTKNSDIYDVPTADTVYIGIATNQETQTESNNFTDYVWSKFKGDDGQDGTDGKSKYTWIKYADTSSGDGISDSPVVGLTPKTNFTLEELKSRVGNSEPYTMEILSQYLR